MTEKILVTLRVEIAGREPAVRHNICVELELIDGKIVRGKLPSSCSVVQAFFEGRGHNILGAVLDWLEKVDESVAYTPAHRMTELNKR